MDAALAKQLSKRRVLIIDDMDSIRNVESACVKQLGFNHVEAVSNGKLALDHIQNNTVDIIICDWDMPQVNGLDVLKALRVMPGHKTTPFIMVTGTHDEEQVKQAVAAGVTDYLVKPFQPNQLAYRVLRCLKSLMSKPDTPQ
ncbi:response regulator [Simiduia agarivorans]|uniref:Response regulator receiver protein n=1 Tax=Simiduia agarivorans (strain DSM 21679 / JCM 13881 / BCRC 17597 / SA1) TaxID=1117647 RepID=K4KE64_SIMAS|nr:response regulator [Simiduia agarivorans]AFU97329.1 response regulator receiver protein [Simiduia agarivorans SA1 = DSM 21679]